MTTPPPAWPGTSMAGVDISGHYQNLRCRNNRTFTSISNSRIFQRKVNTLIGSCTPHWEISRWGAILCSNDAIVWAALSLERLDCHRTPRSSSPGWGPPLGIPKKIQKCGFWIGNLNTQKCLFATTKCSMSCLGLRINNGQRALGTKHRPGVLLMPTFAALRDRLTLPGCAHSWIDAMAPPDRSCLVLWSLPPGWVAFQMLIMTVDAISALRCLQPGLTWPGIVRVCFDHET